METQNIWIKMRKTQIREFRSRDAQAERKQRRPLLAAGRATGIVFKQASAAALAAAIRRALTLYRAGTPWQQMQLAGMAQDHAWTTAAQTYQALYQALARPPPEPYTLNTSS